MAQTNFTPILLYGSTTAAAAPLAANLTTSANGVELAVNAADGKLYYKDSGGTVQVLASKGSGTVGGSNTQVQYNNNGALAGSANLTFNGTKLTANSLAVSATGADIVTLGGGTKWYVSDTYSPGYQSFTTGSNTAGAGITASSIIAGFSVGGVMQTWADASGVYWVSGNSVYIKNNASNVSSLLFGTNADISTSYSYIKADGRASGYLSFYTNNAEALRIDSAGNLGLGVTPSAWSAGKAIEVGSKGTAIWNLNQQNSVYTCNAYYDGSYKYGGAGLATAYQQAAGIHYWYTAPSGTAGNAITFTQAMTLDASGRLGVGVTSPSAILTTQSGAYDGTWTGLRLIEGVNKTRRWDIGAVASSSSNDLLFSENGTTRMVLDSAGNLGLGVTPSAWTTFSSALEVPGGAVAGISANQIGVWQNCYYNTSSFKYKATAAATLYQQAGGSHAWFTAPSGTAGNAITFTQAMTLDASGNLGVGTSSPSFKVDVRSSTASVGTGIVTTASGGSASTYYAASRAWYIGVDVASSNGQFSFYDNTAEAERARIDSSGNLLVGRTATNYASGSGATLQPADQGDSARLDLFTTSTSARTRIAFYSGSSNVGSVSTSGSTTAYNTSSDYRLKEDIAPMTGALAKVAALKPVTYKWKVDGSDGEGFIAHELQEVVPQCVTGEKDAVETYTDEEGNEQTRPVYQGIDTSFLVATLTAAIQEQQALITSLTARIAALETK